MKKIVVVGAGYGGIEAALTLHKRLGRKKKAEITLIDKHPYHTLLTELHEVAGNRVEEDAIRVSLRHIFQYTNVKVVQDEINEYHFEERTVSSQHRRYDYDYLILARGNEPTFYGVEGMAEHALTLWSYDDAVRIREHVKESFSMAARLPDSAEREPYLTLTVVGGGFSGVELVGEFMRWKDQLAVEHGIDPSEAKLVLVEGQDRLCPAVDDVLGKRIRSYMEDNGVRVLTGQFIKQAGEDFVQIGEDTRVSTRTIVWTGGAKGSSGLEDTGLKLTRRDKVRVNDFLEIEEFPGVYAVGDNSSFQVGEQKTELPDLVEGALQTGEAAAHNIVSDVEGKQKRPCVPHLHGVMVSVGRWYGVADLMGVKLVGVWAIIMKHLVNMHYLFGIGGFEQIIRYIRHEFLSLPKDNRTIVEDQFVRQRPLFFLLPLRLYLGYMWLKEGLIKIEEGWFSNEILGEVALRWQDVIPTGILVDVNTSATSMSLISDHTPGWYVWIIRAIIYPNAIWFQRLVVLTEIGLGIAFILGIFTAIAALVSIGLNINFLLTTGLYDYWYIVASIAMLAGAGSVFGGDYLIYPYIMRQWRYFTRNKRIKPFLFR